MLFDRFSLSIVGVVFCGSPQTCIHVPLLLIRFDVSVYEVSCMFFSRFIASSAIDLSAGIN